MTRLPWWYLPTSSGTGMARRAKYSPGPEWKGPYATLRDLKVANSPTYGEIKRLSEWQKDGKS